MIELLILSIILVVYLVYCRLAKNHNYWKERNVPYLKPTLILGNYGDYILQRKYAPKIASDILKQFPSEPYIGTFYGTKPALLLQDPEIIKLVMTKEFYYFNGREVSDYTHREVLTRSINATAGDEWKVLRIKLTPLFTSSKLKNMFPLIQKCTANLKKNLKNEVKISQSINARSLLAKYTMDFIISAIFGINANCMQNDLQENPFIIMGDKMFDSSVTRGVKMVSRSMWPSLFYALGCNLFDEKVSEFFGGLFSKASENRLKDGTSRNDFIDVILQWKKNDYLSTESMSNAKTGEEKIFKLPVTEDLLVGQSLALFGAGYETTSTTMTYVLYELAKNPLIQDKLIQEVDDYFHKHETIEYECLSELPYLEACINETLRLYPVLGVITREVMHDYVLPTGLHLQKGLPIHIPVYHLQRDPKYFPEPEVFRPERFLGEERKKIKQCTFIPFGEGPRICLGKSTFS